MKELALEELHAALATADRGFRLPLVPVLIAATLTAVAVGFALKVLDLSDLTHGLILLLTG